VTDTILRHYWHPVATSNELRKAPLGVCAYLMSESSFGGRKNK
jgi:hypothetical protein